MQQPTSSALDERVDGGFSNPRLMRHLAHLRAPRSKSPLRFEGDALVAVSDALERYSLLGATAILVDPPEAAHATPPAPDVISRNSPVFVPPERFGPEALVLHLGCGAVEPLALNTLWLDVLPSPNVDVVARLENLPLADDCADYVAASAVFEHVRDPLRAIAEVKRVLRPGGEFYIDTAFMQSYHGFPGHYFNLTPLAVETHFGGTFEIIESGVCADSSELVALESMLARFASYLSATERRRFEAQPIGEFLRSVANDRGFSHPLLRTASEYGRRAMAASSFILARKPVGYDPILEGHPDVCRYYEARMAVLLLAHEIDLYRRFAADLGAPAAGNPAPDVLETLREAAPARPTLDAYRAATRALDAVATRLVDLRNPNIRAYLDALEHPKPTEPAAPKRPALFESSSLRIKPGRYGTIAFLPSDDTIGRALDLYGEWAQSECDLLGHYLEPGDVVLDVGANVGSHVLFFSRAVGDAGRVLAFEPQHQAFAVAATNVALNGLSNVSLYRAGVSSEPGWAMPRHSDAAPNNAGAVVLSHDVEAGRFWERAPLLTLDSLELPACRLIKIDVEGMEFAVLRGAERTVARHRPVIYAENTDPARSVAVCRWLMERGYRVFWNAAPAFNPANVAAETFNIFGDASEMGILCLPGEGFEPPDLPESTDPNEFAPPCRPRA